MTDLQAAAQILLRTGQLHTDQRLVDAFILHALPFRCTTLSRLRKPYPVLIDILPDDRDRFEARARDLNLL
jgi:hypothetical protein